MEYYGGVSNEAGKTKSNIMSAPLTTSEIAAKLNTTEKAVRTWESAFNRSATRCDSHAAYYTLVGHAFDNRTLTEENARILGRDMGRRANKLAIA